jgi:hypothetical protein
MDVEVEILIAVSILTVVLLFDTVIWYVDPNV